jgi:hypothetical protein
LERDEYRARNAEFSPLAGAFDGRLIGPGMDITVMCMNDEHKVGLFGRFVLPGCFRERCFREKEKGKGNMENAEGWMDGWMDGWLDGALSTGRVLCWICSDRPLKWGSVLCS